MYTTSKSPRGNGACVAALFLILTSCSTPCRKWEVQTVPSNFTKIYLPTTDKCRGLEVEIDRSEISERMYVNVYSGSIPTFPNQPKKAKILLAIDGQLETVEADLFEGNQRALLPPEVTSRIISALVEGRQVVLGAGRFESEIISDNFGIIYNSTPTVINIPEFL